MLSFVTFCVKTRFFLLFLIFSIVLLLALAVKFPICNFSKFYYTLAGEILGLSLIYPLSNLALGENNTKKFMGYLGVFIAFIAFVIGICFYYLYTRNAPNLFIYETIAIFVVFKLFFITYIFRISDKF